MSATFVFTAEAENQLLDIIDHISAENEDAAVRVRQAMFDAASRLAGMPEMGHTRDDLTRRPVKLRSVSIT
jgi:plasmid stabilization system protein ParE